MNPNTRLSYKLMIFLCITFTCTSILMVIYFLGQSDGLSEDTLTFYLTVYGISIIFWPLIALYSFFRLKGKGNKIIDIILERGAMMVFDGVGAVLHMLVPFFVLVNIEDLGFFQRLSIIILFLLFWCIVLYYVLKITKRRRASAWKHHF